MLAEVQAQRVRVCLNCQGEFVVFHLDTPDETVGVEVADGYMLERCECEAAPLVERMLVKLRIDFFTTREIWAEWGDMPTGYSWAL